jgi:hypothetical protein
LSNAGIVLKAPSGFMESIFMPVPSRRPVSAGVSNMNFYTESSDSGSFPNVPHVLQNPDCLREIMSNNGSLSHCQVAVGLLPHIVRMSQGCISQEPVHVKLFGPEFREPGMLSPIPYLTSASHS